MLLLAHLCRWHSHIALHVRGLARERLESLEVESVPRQSFMCRADLLGVLKEIAGDYFDTATDTDVGKLCVASERVWSGCELDL